MKSSDRNPAQPADQPATQSSDKQRTRCSNSFGAGSRTRRSLLRLPQSWVRRLALCEPACGVGALPVGDRHVFDDQRAQARLSSSLMSLGSFPGGTRHDEQATLRRLCGGVVNTTQSVKADEPSQPSVWTETGLVFQSPTDGFPIGCPYQFPGPLFSQPSST